MIKSGLKTNHKKGYAAAAKARKRFAAEQRQAEYDKLTLDEKIKRATPGSKEYRKLIARKAAA